MNDLDNNTFRLILVPIMVGIIVKKETKIKSNLLLKYLIKSMLITMLEHAEYSGSIYII